MSRANYLRRSLIEAGIGSAIGATGETISAVKGDEARGNIALSALKGALMGGAMLGGIGQVSRMARAAGKYQNQLGVHTRYRGLVDEAKNLESRLPLVKQQLDNWDQASRMEDALSYLRKTQDPSIPSNISRLQHHQSLANLSMAQLDKVHGSLEESLRKFNKDGVKSKTIDEISKGISQIRSRQNYDRAATSKSRKKLGDAITERYGYDPKDPRDRDYVKDLVEGTLETYSDSRLRGVQSKKVYSVATHPGDDYPTIKLTVKKDKDGFAGLVTDQKAEYFTFPNKDRPATNMLVRNTKGNLGLLPKDVGFGTPVTVKEIPAGTPFKKLQDMGYRASSIPKKFGKDLQDDMLMTFSANPKGYRFTGTATPLDKMNSTGTDIIKFEDYAYKYTGLAERKKDFQNFKDRSLAIKDDMKEKQSLIRAVRREAGDIVKEQQQELKKLLQRPRRIDEEKEGIRKSLRDQMENEVYGKWFGVF